MRLDLAAARWSMDMHHVPVGEQLGLWKLVSLLHDVRWHRDRTVGLYCQAHQWALDEDDPYDLGCGRCRMSLGV